MNIFNLLTSGMQAVTSIPGGLLSAKQLASRWPKGPAPGAQWAYRRALYRGSHVCALPIFASCLTRHPATTQGGIWTYPVVYRSHRVLADQNEAMLIAYGQIAALGSTDAFKAADEVVRAANEIATGWPRICWVERDEQTDRRQ